MSALIQKIHLQNVLSYGPNNAPLELRPLNVLIGPNGSGKSNLIECLSVMRASPANLARAIGSVSDFLWKGASQPEALLELYLTPEHDSIPLKHRLVLCERGGRLELVDEAIEDAEKSTIEAQDVRYDYRYQKGRLDINKVKLGAQGFGFSHSAQAAGSKPLLARGNLMPDQSILAQRKDPDMYPALAYLEENYSSMKMYREWNFSRHVPPRQGQRTDIPRIFLEEDASNLALVLNYLEDFPDVHPRILDLLKQFDEDITDYKTILAGTNEIQLYITYAGLNKSIPATRLSDGTLRFLCLLAILCHPEMPPVICIEEPEIGLHPDSILVIADLLKEASARCQLFITTHSEILVDSLTDTPESVIVCEKQGGESTLRRLDPEQLSAWLEKYRLGQLWTMGEIGGNRW